MITIKCNPGLDRSSRRRGRFYKRPDGNGSDYVSKSGRVYHAFDKDGKPVEKLDGYRRSSRSDTTSAYNIDDCFKFKHGADRPIEARDNALKRVYDAYDEDRFDNNFDLAGPDCTGGVVINSDDGSTIYTWDNFNGDEENCTNFPGEWICFVFQQRKEILKTFRTSGNVASSIVTIKCNPSLSSRIPGRFHKRLDGNGSDYVSKSGREFHAFDKDGKPVELLDGYRRISNHPNSNRSTNNIHDCFYIRNGHGNRSLPEARDKALRVLIQYYEEERFYRHDPTGTTYDLGGSDCTDGHVINNNNGTTYSWSNFNGDEKNKCRHSDDNKCRHCGEEISFIFRKRKEILLDYLRATAVPPPTAESIPTNNTQHLLASQNTNPQPGITQQLKQQPVRTNNGHSVRQNSNHKGGLPYHQNTTQHNDQQGRAAPLQQHQRTNIGQQTSHNAVGQGNQSQAPIMMMMMPMPMQMSAGVPQSNNMVGMQPMMMPQGMQEMMQQIFSNNGGFLPSQGGGDARGSHSLGDSTEVADELENRKMSQPLQQATSQVNAMNRPAAGKPSCPEQGTDHTAFATLYGTDESEPGIIRIILHKSNTNSRHGMTYYAQGGQVKVNSVGQGPVAKVNTIKPHMVIHNINGHEITSVDELDRQYDQVKGEVQIDIVESDISSALKQPTSQKRSTSKHIQKLHVSFAGNSLGLKLSLEDNTQIKVIDILPSCPHPNLIKQNDVLVGVNGKTFKDLGIPINDESFDNAIMMIKNADRPIQLMFERWVNIISCHTQQKRTTSNREENDSNSPPRHRNRIDSENEDKNVSHKPNKDDCSLDGVQSEISIALSTSNRGKSKRDTTAEKGSPNSHPRQRNRVESNNKSNGDEDESSQDGISTRAPNDKNTDKDESVSVDQSSLVKIKSADYDRKVDALEFEKISKSCTVVSLFPDEFTSKSLNQASKRKKTIDLPSLGKWNKVQVLEKLGEGVYGSVWKCKLYPADSSDPIICAVKVQIPSKDTSLSSLSFEFTTQVSLAFHAEDDEECPFPRSIALYTYTGTDGTNNGGLLFMTLESGVTVHDIAMNAFPGGKQVPMEIVAYVADSLLTRLETLHNLGVLVRP